MRASAPPLETRSPVKDLPYPPSWQNRFFSTIRQLPLPRLPVYLLIALGFSLLNLVAPWLEGGLPAGEIDLYQLNFQVWLLVVMLAGDYFVAAAGRAMDQFRPALSVDDDTFDRLRYEFTTVPERTGWAVTGIAVVLAFWGISFGRPYQQAGLSAVVLYLTSLFMFWLVLFFMYFLWRVVRRTVDLYDRIQDINVFHLEPLYAFSGLSSRIGIFLVLTGVLSYLSNFVFTESPNVAGFAFFAIINVAVAISAFLYPLYGIHLRLAAAKEGVAEANDLRLESAYRDLHRRVDAHEVAGMGDLHHEIQALLEFRREIQATSTWPWQSGTLRAFATALLLPIILWASQQILQRFLDL
jgi:hypothetical protein